MENSHHPSDDTRTIHETQVDEALLVSQLLESFYGDLMRYHLVSASCDTVLNREELPSAENLCMARISRLRFRKRHDLHTAIQTLYRVLYAQGLPMVHLVRVLKGQTELYLGVFSPSQDRAKSHEVIDAFLLLKSTLEGLIPGCRIEEVEPKTKNPLAEVSSLPRRHVVTGIPSVKKTDRPQERDETVIFGIDRLTDSMGGDEFALVVSAWPVVKEDLEDYKSKVDHWLDLLHPFAKTSVQAGTQETETETTGLGLSTSQSNTFGTTHTDGSSTPRKDGWIGSRVWKGLKSTGAGGDRPTSTKTEQDSVQYSRTRQDTVNLNIALAKARGTSLAHTREHIHRHAAYLESILEILHDRIQEGRGTGMWRTSVMVLAKESAIAEKAAVVLKGILAGDDSHVDPIRSLAVSHEHHPLLCGKLDCLENWHPVGTAYEGLYTYLTSSELAMVADLPAHEVPSLVVREITEYGRSQGSQVKNELSVVLGRMVDRGRDTSEDVVVSTERLNRHCFVTGVTGSGKTNTVKGLLQSLWTNKHPIPFLVIEPVKSEYRNLRSTIEELQVFTLGRTRRDDVGVISLNPFDFDRSVGLVPHIDYLKAAFNASLGSYSSMPYILERAIYIAYERLGWDLTTGDNIFFQQSLKALGFDDHEGRELREWFLPCLSDMEPLIDKAVEKSFPGKSTEYATNLVGALKARIHSLTVGSKGCLLDSRHSVSTELLLKKPCVLELYPFSDNDEKAFIMALVLIKLYEYREGLGPSANRTGKLEHLLVFEEAHRLLSKSQSHSELTGDAKGKAIELFTDMLAEIRSYGEGILIVDQIPSKLVPEVLKNTDVKIAHRLVAKDDREILGATMALDDSQTNDLARLEQGVATVYFEGLDSPIQVRIPDNSAPETGSLDNIDLVAEPRLKVFGWEASDTGRAFSDIMVSRAFLWVRSVMVVALAGGESTLLGIQEALLRTIHKEASAKDPGQPEQTTECTGNPSWAFLVEGLYQLETVLEGFGLSPGFSRLLTSMCAAFTREFLHRRGFTDTLQSIRRYSELFAIARVTGENDILSLLVKSFLNDAGQSFHDKVSEALLEIAEKAGVTGIDMRETDMASVEFLWEPLRLHLDTYVSDISMHAPLPVTDRARLALRLMLEFRVHRGTIQEKLAAVAAGELKTAIDIETLRTTRGEI